MKATEKKKKNTISIFEKKFNHNIFVFIYQFPSKLSNLLKINKRSDNYHKRNTKTIENRIIIKKILIYNVEFLTKSLCKKLNFVYYL